MPRPAHILPPQLLPGDTIGIVAPASNIDGKALTEGCERLRRLGYLPYYLDSILERDVYFAGSVQRRVAELEHMFARPEVRAIVCARGGYGCNHLLPHLKIEKLLETPKPFVGYSDITTLLTLFADHGMATFHGPMVTKDFAHEGGVDLDSWNTVLGGCGNYDRPFAGTEIESLVPGEAEGVWYGGCLSILVASLGTPYEIQTEGTILFLEDINAKPYQVDRMLMQLKLADKFEDVRGVLFGEMMDCVQPSGQDYRLQEIILNVLSEFRVPIAYGYASGHVRENNHVIPIGVSGTLNVGDDVRISFRPSVQMRTPQASQERTGR